MKKIKKIAQQCHAVRIRILMRMITKLYDKALRPLDVRVTQVNVLAAISALGSTKAMELARVLCLEKSSISRDLDRLFEKGWVSQELQRDGRSVVLDLTPSGEALLQSILPAWEEAQRAAEKQFGKETLRVLAVPAEFHWKSQA